MFRSFFAERLVRPAQAFVGIEASGGLVLLAATAIAIAWANSPWDGDYHDLWHARLALDFNLFRIDETLGHLVNDGLMAIFFFVVGLEIKRELVEGELASPRRAALPVAAALGGMIVPALIYLAWNAGSDGQHGWGIPMATDIAFALGALALLGSRVPFGLKVFLLALAIADDLGAIAVIAIFYTNDLSPEALAWAGAALALILAVRRAGVRSTDVYVVLGALLWVAVLKSGIHATIAGVVLAALTPARPDSERAAFDDRAHDLLDRFRAARAAGDHESEQLLLKELEWLARGAESPLDRLERVLHPWVSYLVVPVFALANAGLVIDRDALRAAAESPVTMGIIMGLVLGKVTGITAFAWIAVRLGWAALPAGVNWRGMVGAGLLGGIGFTVSLFITGLAFDNATLVAEAKMGILAASVIAGALGMAALALQARRETAAG
ncbi:MAG: Na+/H+ antiporter NhaA [Thermoflexaceae bacterium]|nr:Na+/H+ antiporter NhaA [Thermoflexaceae bacterium]